MFVSEKFFKHTRPQKLGISQNEARKYLLALKATNTKFQ